MRNFMLFAVASLLASVTFASQNTVLEISTGVYHTGVRRHCPEHLSVSHNKNELKAVAISIPGISCLDEGDVRSYSSCDLTNQNPETESACHGRKNSSTFISYTAVNRLSKADVSKCSKFDLKNKPAPCNDLFYDVQSGKLIAAKDDTLITFTLLTPFNSTSVISSQVYVLSRFVVQPESGEKKLLVLGSQDLRGPSLYYIKIK